ncbi:MAG: hypothetical protein LKJ75_02525 [Clostridia bacterium]|jgi:hypothetical protein|nr:hypothetical protein [Clostridia bacterium]MCI2014059.1 hypothetical protein [Clostridia bacterium]
MLVAKGNISRNIDNNKLQFYISKGYKVVEPDKKAKKAAKSGGEDNGTDGTGSKA